MINLSSINVFSKNYLNVSLEEYSSFRPLHYDGNFGRLRSLLSNKPFHFQSFRIFDIFYQFGIINDVRFSRYNFIEISIPFPHPTMLKQVALILASPKYDNLITLTQSTLTIHNQYVFLWSVLPKMSGKFTRRTQFVKEMKSYGFQLINQKRGTDKENNNQSEVQDEKNLVFKAKCYEFMSSLKKIEQIKQKRVLQKSVLNQRLKSLSSKILHMKRNGSQNMAQQYELFEEISSLNRINRNVLMHNEEIDCLMYSNFQLKDLNIGQETTYEMLSFCFDNDNKPPLTKYKMKSSKNLRELHKTQ